MKYLGKISDDKDLVTKEYVDDHDSALKEYVDGTVVTGALAAGATTLDLTCTSVTSNSKLDIYTSVYGISPTAVVINAGSGIALTFKAQSSEINVRVEVR